MQKSFGWGYSDTIFHFHNDAADILRPREDHLVLFKKEFGKKYSKKWFEKYCNEFDALLDSLKKFYKENSNIKNKKNSEIIKVYNKYFEFIGEIMGPFIVMYWIPNWFENDKKFNNITKKALYYRKKSEWVFPEGDILIRDILNHLSKKYKIEKNLLNFINKKELEELLKENKVLDLKKLKRRKNNSIYYSGGILIIKKSLKESLNEIGFDIKEVILEKNELKGNCAYKGKVNGAARVILSKEKINSIKNNEILVTSMTTPEFVPAMKKASAIITDEGGITCHAAIVARELKKPCIIGTRNATRLLKDGDLIEIDANKGIIKKLNKSNQFKN